MGRGRQKAKQMKVARRLKYSVHETDLSALQRELSGAPEDADFDDELEDDPYAIDADSPKDDEGESGDDWDPNEPWFNPGSR